MRFEIYYREYKSRVEVVEFKEDATIKEISDYCKKLHEEHQTEVNVDFVEQMIFVGDTEWF